MSVVVLSESLSTKRGGGRQKVAGEGHCRMCRRPSSVRPLTRHHLVPQQWFRPQPTLAALYRDCDANIVPLCWPCHCRCERELSERKLLRKVMTQAEVAYCIQVRGVRWLDQRYPPSKGPTSAYETPEDFTRSLLPRPQAVEDAFAAALTGSKSSRRARRLALDRANAVS